MYVKGDIRKMKISGIIKIKDKETYDKLVKMSEKREIEE